MQLRFIKPDSGYLAVELEGAPGCRCTLRLPWRVSLDGVLVRNRLHGEEMHLLTGIWSISKDSIIGRTLVDPEIELWVRVATALADGEAEDPRELCRFELSMLNRGSITRAAPSLVVGFEPPPPPRRLQLGASDVHVTDAAGRLWSLCWPNPPILAPWCERQTLPSASPATVRAFSSNHQLRGRDIKPGTDSVNSSGVMLPCLERVGRDLVSITLPLGCSIEPGKMAGIAGELAVVAAAMPPSVRAASKE